MGWDGREAFSFIEVFAFDRGEDLDLGGEDFNLGEEDFGPDGVKGFNLSLNMRGNLGFGGEGGGDLVLECGEGGGFGLSEGSGGEPGL